MTAFLAALQLLTIVPVWRTFEQRVAAHALLYFPLVGFAIGLLLLGVGALSMQAPALGATLVLVIWVLSTGGLHLDGLADSADAWAAARGDKQRALQVMKDPRCGPFAVVTLVLLLLTKFAALSALFAGSTWPLLLVAPVLARAAVLALYSSTPYVRENGMGQIYADTLDNKLSWGVVGFTALACALLAGWLAVLLATAAMALLRWLMVRQIGGMTGDTIGAMVELVEAAVLISLVMTPA